MSPAMLTGLFVGWLPDWFLAIWHPFIGLVGGLALFLYGIDKMSEALRAAAGEGLKTLLARMTSHPAGGVVTGILITAIVQSSSLTTVLVVGFVTAGLMTLRQSIGVILGANIGTTLTTHVAAFDITESAWLLIGLGFLVAMFSRRDLARQLGSVLLGLGFLFLALEQMSASTNPLRTYPIFLELMQRMENPWVGIAMGAIFTAVIQSSSATSGVVIALTSQGAITLPAALAVILGANLGSCVTALLAAWGKPAEARQAALVHVAFNGVGVLAWGMFLPQLAVLVERLTTELPRQVANAHTVFNVVNTLVLIWFIEPLARFVEWLVPAPARVAPPVAAQPKFLDETLLATPALALDRVRLELTHMGELVLKMFDAAASAVPTGTAADLQRIADMDHDVNQLYVSIIDYTRLLARRELTTAETQKLENGISAANYLESMGDVIATNLVTQGTRRLDRRLQMSGATVEVLQELFRFVRTTLQDSLTAPEGHDAVLAAQVLERKAEFNRLSARSLEHLRRRLVAAEPGRVVAFQVEVDLVNLLQRVFYFARRIARLAVPAAEEIATEQASPHQDRTPLPDPNEGKQLP